MSNVINGKFVNFNVVGETKKEALDKAEELVIMGDATQAFKNWQKKVGANYTEKDVKDFMDQINSLKYKLVVFTP